MQEPRQVSFKLSAKIYIILVFLQCMAGVDFSNMAMTFTVPGNVNEFIIPNFFTVVDDEVNEISQSFALVAELGLDVPDDLACFQIIAGTAQCLGTGRLGATEIRITDNDGRLFLLQHTLQFYHDYYSYGHWFSTKIRYCV